jgi:ornithine--oxo-acid transaminase
LEENLIALLSHFAPSHSDSRIFFSNSGAEAIETAIKFAKMARPKATKFINFRSAYHGKTHAALSLTPSEEYQKPFRPLPLDVVTLPYGDIRAFKRAIREHGPDKICAVFIEPAQGEAGVILPPPGYLKELGEVCNKHGILICVDEIQTGLGRCGEWFLSLAEGLEPDMITLAKPLGGGIAAIGVTIARREIFSKMLSGMSCKRHSNTFGGASLAMAIGLKSLEILVEENLPARSKRLGEIGLKRLTNLQESYPDLLEAVRGRGLLMALQFKNVTPFHLPFVGEMVSELCGALGLRMLHSYLVMANLSLSSKRVVRLTPALNIPDDVFAKLIDRVEIAASKNPDSLAMLRHTPMEMLVRLAKFSL